MFSLFKKYPQVPEWASFFNSKEYQSFLDAVKYYFDKKNINYRIDDGVLHTKVNDFGFKILGLMNVSQVCKQDDIENYNLIVEEHFETMINANNFETEFNKIVHDFDKIKEYLGVRLHHIDYVVGIGRENTFGRILVEDIYAMIVLDLPHSIVNVKPEHLKLWNKDEDELFEIGTKNIKEKYEMSISKEDLGEFSIWFTTQHEHFFTPNIVLDLENREELIGTYGSLIGIPHRHSVLIYPIENLEVVKAVNRLIPIIQGMNEEGPGSISGYLLWFYNGIWANIPYRIEDNQVQIIPPDNFVEMLNQLE
jgi:hypothetical protein